MSDQPIRRTTRYGGRTDVGLAVVLDCNDLDRTEAFWEEALGYKSVPLKPTAGPYRVLLPTTGEGIELLLQKVPEPKVVKNRMHFDLRVVDLDAEVARLIALGARRVTTEPLEGAGWKWHVLEDPDGNEFCVLRPAQDDDRDGLDWGNASSLGRLPYRES